MLNNWDILQEYMVDSEEEKEFLFYDKAWHYILWRRGSEIRLSHFFYYGITVTPDDIKDCIIYKAKSYKDLKRRYGIDAFKVDFMSDYVYWLAPNGDAYTVEAHAVDAIGICKWMDIEYPIDSNYDCSDAAQEALLDRGWIRLSVHFWDMYLRDNECGWEMTAAQRDKIWDFCLEHRLKYPDDIIEIIS